MVKTFADLLGYPYNVQNNGRGQFWISINYCRSPIQEVMSRNPLLKLVYFRLLVSMAYLARWLGMYMFTIITLFYKVYEFVVRLGYRETHGYIWILPSLQVD